MIKIILNFFKDRAEKLAEKATKSMPRKIAAMVSTVITTLFTILPLVLISSVILIVIVAIDWVTELFTAKANAKEIYNDFKVKDMSDIIQIKKNNEGEYYLDFIDEVDEVLENYINKVNMESGFHNLPKDIDFLKDILKAEVCMKYPNLGGNVPEEGDGFQGVVNFRRVTPDKDIGAMINTGAGKTTVIEEETIDDIVQISEYEEFVKGWEKNKELTLISRAIVYKERESKLHPGTGTGYFDVQYRSDSDKKLMIPKGSTVTYTGNYKNSVNSLTKKVTTYVEVKYEDITGYILAQTLITKDGDDTEHITEEISKVKDVRTTSRAKGLIMGQEGKTYTIAIAAGHNNTDNTGASSGGLVEEELTIKVAEKVEELLKDYSNVKVVQTGSTSDNPGGVKLSERRQLAKDANPDLCIQIHFNAGGGTGSEVIYKKDDGISQELAEILSKTISNSMGIKNRGEGSDIEKSGKSLTIIENAASTGFPSVVTEGAFLDGNPDADIIKNQNGILKYAQGIVDGLNEYFKSEHKGHTSTNKEHETVTTSIRSNINNLKYIPLDDFRQLVNENDTRALKLLTLDEEKKVITATWYIDEEGNIIVVENPPVDLTTTLQQYIVPFEYLMFFYIDSNYEGFSKDLADVILKSEVVIAVQDNITTTQKVTVTQYKTEASDTRFSIGWTDSGSTKLITEEVSTSTNVTYVDTWCVKTYNDVSYSTKSLGMGDKDKITINVSGTVNESTSNTLTDAQVTGSGTASGGVDAEGNPITYNYVNYSRESITTDIIANEYEFGNNHTKGVENKFIKLYHKHNMVGKVRSSGYLFTIIEQNEKTANLLNLTKYLIYKATDMEFGVVEYEFGEFELKTGNDNSDGDDDGNYEIVGDGGGYSFTENDTIVWKNNYTKDNLVTYLRKHKVPNASGCASGSGLATNQQGWDTFYKGCAEQWFDICTKYGIDPIVIMSWSLHESGYGTSRYAQERGNLWGWGAYNENPDHALSGSGSSKANKAMNLLEEICKSLNKTIKDPNYNGRRDIAISKGLKNPDLTTIKGTGYWYCVPPDHWIESTVNMLKNRFGEFVSQYCSNGGSSSQIGEVTLKGDNADKMKKLLNDAIRIANDDRYTYSKSNRYGEFQYDCSSFVYRLYKKYFGIELPTTTGDYSKFSKNLMRKRRRSKITTRRCIMERWTC